MAKKGNRWPGVLSGKGQCAPSDDMDVAAVLGVVMELSSSAFDQRESVVSLREKPLLSTREKRVEDDPVP